VYSPGPAQLLSALAQSHPLLVLVSHW